MIIWAKEVLNGTISGESDPTFQEPEWKIVTKDWLQLDSDKDFRLG